MHFRHLFTLAVKHGPTVWRLAKSNDEVRQRLEDALGLSLAELPHAHSFVVDALNSELPLERQTWTSQKLFLFIALHIKTGVIGIEHRAEWLITPDKIVQRLLRGSQLAAPNAKALEELLLEECDDIFCGMPGLAVQMPIDASHADDSEDAVDMAQAGSMELGAAKSAVEFGRRVAAGTGAAIHAQKAKLVNRKKLKVYRELLLENGSSSTDCHRLFSSLGYSAEDIRASSALK